jgi:type VI secretion system secreted protein VgrG
MTDPLFTQERLLFTVTTPLGDNKLLFKSFQGEEQLSQLFHFQLEMLSESKQLDFDAIVGQPLTLTVQFAPDHTRYFHGLVTHFVQAGTDARFTVYHAQVRPWLYLLTLTKDCRIFQNRTVAEIIKQVFDDLGLTDYRFALFYRYEPRVYCVQYEETAFNFVSRLMEDEGIFYFFEHHEDKHVLVLADHVAIHAPCPGIPTARFLTITNDTQPEDAITAGYFQQQVTTDRYTIDDFNFEIPLNKLRSSIESLRRSVQGKGNNLRIYEYAAGFSRKSQGEEKVKVRIQGQEVQHQQLEGQGHCLSFASGYRFQLTDHPRSDLNQEYVLQWVSHSLSLTHYSNSFLALPFEVAFRPPLVTPKPKIVSAQTAIVTGPKGEEIWTDQYGRIKVQFHWDQDGQYDDQSSCWIRVNQGWGGQGWGNICLPRIGQEVIVSFLEGDPDRPIVTGGVFNAVQTVPYALPSGQNQMTFKTNSTPGGGGFNEIRLDDSKNHEEIYIHGQKDWNMVIEHDRTQQIGHDETLTVAHDRTRTVHHDETITIDNDLTTTVHHDETITIAHDRTKQVKNHQQETIAANKSITVGKEHHETIGEDMTLQVEGHKSESVGKTSTETVGMLKMLNVGGAYQLGVGAAMNTTVALGQFEQVGLVKHVRVGSQLVLECGQGKIIIDSSGKITIEGTEFVFTASGDVKINGKVIDLN